MCYLRMRVCTQADRLRTRQAAAAEVPTRWICTGRCRQTVDTHYHRGCRLVRRQRQVDKLHHDTVWYRKDCVAGAPTALFNRVKHNSQVFTVVSLKSMSTQPGTIVAIQKHVLHGINVYRRFTSSCKQAVTLLTAVQHAKPARHTPCAACSFHTPALMQPQRS